MSGNRNSGRKLGSKNTVTADFVNSVRHAIAALGHPELQTGSGIELLVLKLEREKPEALVPIINKLMPAQVELDADVDATVKIEIVDNRSAVKR
jgi:hypothetical protein